MYLWYTWWSCCLDSCGDLLALGLGALMSPVVAGGRADLQTLFEQTLEADLQRILDTHGDTHLVGDGGGVLGANGLGVGALSRNCPPGVVTRQHNLEV